ncbi:MAG: cupin domain-containing protein [Proteobacteria bacterium]|nr:cupin domain-containing protein [Pseudomonadota bacterium]
MTNILGDMTPSRFLDQHWQRVPLLVRGALRDLTTAMTSADLIDLAMDADVESRIIAHHGADSRWEMRQGPFLRDDFRSMPEVDWTLLVQAVDLWVPRTRSILQHFDFLPPWRLDDIMASYAVEGGSVGPHFDQYDVFLLQVEGRRRWQIGAACPPDSALLADCDLSLLADFRPQQEWLLEPGDMLYLPPRIAHWGVAETPCITYSVGFRSPTLADMLGDLAIELSAQGNVEHYFDPRLTPEMAGTTIHQAFVEQAKRQLHDLIDDDALIAEWFARFMTAAKYPSLVDRTGERRAARINGRRYQNGDDLD